MGDSCGSPFDLMVPRTASRLSARSVCGSTPGAVMQWATCYRLSAIPVLPGKLAVLSPEGRKDVGESMEGAASSSWQMEEPHIDSVWVVSVAGVVERV